MLVQTDIDTAQISVVGRELSDMQYLKNIVLLTKFVTAVWCSWVSTRPAIVCIRNYWLY